MWLRKALPNWFINGTWTFINFQHENFKCHSSLIWLADTLSSQCRDFLTNDRRCWTENGVEKVKQVASVEWNPFKVQWENRMIAFPFCQMNDFPQLFINFLARAGNRISSNLLQHGLAIKVLFSRSEWKVLKKKLKSSPECQNVWCEGRIR